MSVASLCVCVCVCVCVRACLRACVYVCMHKYISSIFFCDGFWLAISGVLIVELMVLVVI